MKITFVNHASIIISNGNTNIITDPYLFGKSFNNGWDLVSKSKLTVEDFKDINFIWFSHEHPDHFNLTVLNKIPFDIRKNISILFQQTLDHRVYNKCKELGFKKIIELEKYETYELPSDIEIKCMPVGFYDSWLYVKINNTKILNLNDCVMNTDKKITDIKKLFDGIDILLTQFSYASKIGNKDQKYLREQEAKNVLDGIKKQIEILEPKFVIPFASFIRYTHKDNTYMNDSMNKIRDVSNVISNQTKAIPIILYPGESWDCKTPTSNLSSITRFEQDYERKFTPCEIATVTPLSTLKKQCDEYRSRIRQKNSYLLIKFLYKRKEFTKAKIFLRDLNIPITFDLLEGLKESDFDKSDADIITDSDSLGFVFRFEYGADTLHVNGRFETSGGDISNFFNTFRIGTLNNNGRTAKDLFKIGIKKKLSEVF